MTMGYESYIIVIVENYILKIKKATIFWIFQSCLYYEGANKERDIAEYYDFSENKGKRIKEDLKNWGVHHLTISRLPADFFRMSKCQLEKLFERASDAFIARMYDVPEQQIQNRRDDFGISN